VLQNQGLLGSAFFEATASIILLVLFALFRGDQNSRYFRAWLVGWIFFTGTALAEVAVLTDRFPYLGAIVVLGHAAALLFFFFSVLELTASPGRRRWPMIPAAAVALLWIFYLERGGLEEFGAVHWGTAAIESGVCLAAGLLMWRWASGRAGHGMRLLGGLFLLAAIHGLDRPSWPQHPQFILRVAFDHLLGVALGIAMIVVVLERARARTEELNDKMRRITLLTAASTQTLSVDEALDGVLKHLVASVGATHGIVRLLEADGRTWSLVARASVGFSPRYLTKYARLPRDEAWAIKVLNEDRQWTRFEDEQDPAAKARMTECGMREMITIALRGKEGPLGIIAVGSTREVKFLADEVDYLVNLSNLLGLTLQNVKLFEQVAAAQQQWADTFDSIGDPILVHDRAGRVLRVNQRLSHLLSREYRAMIGRDVSDTFSRKEVAFVTCPYCEGHAGEGDHLDPWLPGYFLASNSTFTDASGNELGVVHVLKDITERKRAEDKYRVLVASVQEGIFISTPQGRFLDFNDAMLRMTGYDTREELMAVDIATKLFVNPSDRDRLRRILQDHSSVADFEFEMRRKDGEVRNILESSTAVRDSAGQVTAYQGFVLDITERKSAESEIRRRNRELMVLNSISQTLTESMDLGDSLQRTLRQIVELFHLDVSSIYLLETDGSTLRRLASAGHHSEQARTLPTVSLPPGTLQQITAVHATFLSTQALPIPQLVDVMQQEGVVAAYAVILWAKNRVLGGLVIGNRNAREFSPADINLLIAVGSQISSAMQRSLLHEETRQAYDNLRRTQEQLLHSDKMAAVGQLISGVAHELNNPLTAILGYSQLLTSSGQTGPQGLEYAEKLYKQAQRTHRIVQNLLSFSRQHKPERVAVQLNQILEDTLALRDYDLRMSNIRVHMELREDLPEIAADPHQLQQVFLNMVNNAVDAILEHSVDGDLWVRTEANEGTLFVEFTDSGPGVKDPSRVFDPFYTTKPVGKGTGLGLSICYGIITEHGGNIQVRNVPSRGASFRIALPLRAKTGTEGEGARSGELHITPLHR